MKRSFKRVLIAVLLVFTSLFALAGCSFKVSLDEYLADKDLVARVTYYTNGGAFDNKKDIKDMYYKENQLPLNIGKADIESGTIKLERADHEFLGWYYVQGLDENGKPLKDANGDILMGEPVDFSVPMQKGDHWNVCAMWATLAKVKVKLVCDEGVKIHIETNLSGEPVWKECVNGDIIRDYSFYQGYMQSTVTPNLQVQDKTHTFLKFFADEACTKEVAWPIAQPAKDAAEKDAFIYAKYIAGDWTVVRNGEDVGDMFADATKENKRFYLLSDIDCQGETYDVSEGFNCEVQGNGYTVRNFKLVKSGIINYEKVSFFGRIGEKAKIENVNFEDFTAEYATMHEALVYIHFAFSSISDKAVVNNVNLDGQVKVTLAKDAVMIEYDATQHWKYGGFDNDEAYTGGITVSEESKIEVVNN